MERDPCSLCHLALVWTLSEDAAIAQGKQTRDTPKHFFCIGRVHGFRSIVIDLCAFRMVLLDKTVTFLAKRGLGRPQKGMVTQHIYSP